MIKITTTFSAISFALIGLSLGCSKPESSSPSPAARFFHAESVEVTEANYLNGKAFCQTYSKITSKENGRYIQVPVNYADETQGSLEIYAWSIKPFEPKFNTLVFVDGGPGQNTHSLPASMTGEWNELHFDQRGLGCSSPSTFSQYKNIKLYSTENTVRDMDLVRKSFGIEKWSVFGISYGTVPGTIYGSKYPEHTTAVVLEGVANSYEDLGSADWRAVKFNLMLKQLNSAQVAGFENLVQDNRYNEIIGNLIFDNLYSDFGFQESAKFLKTIIAEDGTIDYSELNKKTEREIQRQDKNKTPYGQSPMGIDDNVFSVIYCRDLGSDLITKKLDYNFDDHAFISKEITSPTNSCSTSKVPYSERKAYVAKDYPVKIPISYFQGSHDGATLARGAVKHYLTVPQGVSNFILMQKGGHNPLSTSVIDWSDPRGESSGSSFLSTHRAFLAKTLLGNKMSSLDIINLNQVRNWSANDDRYYGQWVLLDKNDKTSDFNSRFNDELDGIYLRPNQAVSH